jgi:hypothetical protein
MSLIRANRIKTLNLVDIGLVKDQILIIRVSQILKNPVRMIPGMILRVPINMSKTILHENWSFSKTINNVQTLGEYFIQKRDAFGSLWFITIQRFAASIRLVA